jgi:hypothetical protein
MLLNQRCKQLITGKSRKIVRNQEDQRMRSTQFEEPEHANQAVRVKLSSATLRGKNDRTKRSGGLTTRKPAK